MPTADEPPASRPVRAYAALRDLLQFDVREQGRLLAHLARWIVLGSLVGVLAGVSSAVFLTTLSWVTDLRVAHGWLIVLLPVAGFAVALVYTYAGGRSGGGNNLILDEIHEPSAWIPTRMAALVYASTVVTHLFGGSAGREGTAVQMAGSLTDGASRLLRLGPGDRRVMLIAALGGGFGAVFGVPIAGCVFGLEVQSMGRMRYDALAPTLTASLVGDLVVRAFGVHHMVTPPLGAVDLTAPLLAKVALAGLAFGSVALIFTELTHGIRRTFASVRLWAPLRPVIGGLALVGLTLLVGDQAYNGLSIPLMTDSLAGGAGIVTFAFGLKLLFTAVTLGAGFHGGEVTPLFVIGATSGVTLGRLLGVPVELMAAIGFVAVFAGAANVPLTCTVMGAELFGSNGFVLFAVACVISYVFSSHRGIYPSQRIGTAKGGDALADVPDEGDTLHDVSGRRTPWLPKLPRPRPGATAPDPEPPHGMR